MFPVYEEKKKNLHIHLRTSAHASPHLYNSIEFIYITVGTPELGMGQELYHMEEGDLAVEQAYVQILLARSISCFRMMEKSRVESNDIISREYRTLCKEKYLREGQT